MERGTYIDKTINSKEEIDQIVAILKKYNYEELTKTSHYELSIIEKGAEEELLKRTFAEFNRIKLVNLRKRKNGKDNHDLYYLMDDGKYILYAINLDKRPPLLINAIHANMNFKNFINNLFKTNIGEAFN